MECSVSKALKIIFHNEMFALLTMDVVIINNSNNYAPTIKSFLLFLNFISICYLVKHFSYQNLVQLSTLHQFCFYRSEMKLVNLNAIMSEDVFVVCEGGV